MNDKQRIIQDIGPHIINLGDFLSLSIAIGGKTSYEGIYQVSDKLQGRDGKVYKNGSDFLNTWR